MWASEALIHKSHVWVRTQFIMNFDFDNRSLLIPPPNSNLPYALAPGLEDKDKDTSQSGQVKTLRAIFDEVISQSNWVSNFTSIKGFKCSYLPYGQVFHSHFEDKGFFVEVGAFDGVFLSNTLWFERNWNWTGLLLEANPRVFSTLVTRNRRAWLGNLCLSTQKEPGYVSCRFLL